MHVTEKTVPLLSEEPRDHEVFAYVYWICHHTLYRYSPVTVGRDGWGFDFVQWENGTPSEEALDRLKKNHTKLREYDWTEINGVYLESEEWRKREGPGS